MMVQPPAFSYGSSINIWLFKDKSHQTREIAVTGHADSATCRRVSGQVMSLFLEKNTEPEDLFVAGAANMVDRGDPAKKQGLLKQKSVEEYLDAQDQLWAAELALQVLTRSGGKGEDDKSAVEQAQIARLSAQRRVDQLRTDDSVQNYLRENESAEAINNFVAEIRRFSGENGLVNIHEVPLELLEQARARIADLAVSPQGKVVSFEDLLENAGMPEAALFTPVLAVPSGRPVELRIPLASLQTANFAEAQRTNRSEVEQAIIGNAKDRLKVFTKSREDDLKDQARCEKLSDEELRKPVSLSEVCTNDGICHTTDKPITTTMLVYCTVNVPFNLKLDTMWIAQTDKLLKRLDEDAERKDGSRVQEFDYATLVDSMLRDWRLPVARSQVAFDMWREVTRGPVWRLLNAQLNRMHIARDVIGGEQMVFSVRVDHDTLIVRPIHVVDLARSVMVADPASGATRVLDAWSMRSQNTGTMAPPAPVPPVQGLVNDAIRLLASGDRRGAETQIKAAFSRDPTAAFRAVEREWLQQFPDTRQQMLATQEELKPLVEVLEWNDGLEAVKFDPSSKEGIREEIEAFHSFLETYPKAPVDLYLSFALRVAGYWADWQNDLNKRAHSSSLPFTAWTILQAYIPRATSTGIARKTAPVNRKAIEAYLRNQGLKGARLQQAVEAVLSIRRSATDTESDNNHLKARLNLSLLLLRDPAPLISEALKVVITREPAYWATAVRESGLPKEPSIEWTAARNVMDRKLTLFESDAQFLARLADQLQKSYSSLTAADILSVERKPNLSQALSFINVAVGDGRTGSRPAFLGPQQAVQVVIQHRKVMNLLTRLENANYLRRGSDELLAIARSRILDRGSPEAFRDAIPLRANLWFESGNYIKALEALLSLRVPIALYSPTLSWRSLPGDAVKKPLSVTARLDDSRVVFEATFEGDKKADVLVLENLSPADAQALQKDFSDTSPRIWGDYGKVSDQILLTSVPLRPALGKLRDLLLSPSLRTLLVKSMVYGRNAPGSDLVQQTNGKVTERVVASVDRVSGDQGRTYQIPTLNEVKHLAKTKVRPQ
jgi:hypothetical protein